jgi:AcrR family transcriptional regulator
VAAARRLFLDQGYEAVSIDDIAGVAGVARQTVFNRFKSKDAVFRAMVADHWERWGNAVGVSSVRHEDPVDDHLRAIARGIAAFQDDPDQIKFQRLIVGESRRLDWIGPAAYRAGKGPRMQALADHFGRLHAEGRLACPDPVLAAWQFVGLVQEFLVWPQVMDIGDAAAALPSADVVIEEAILTFLARYGVR